jgi:serine/threonine-protein kinase RsbT
MHNPLGAPASPPPAFATRTDPRALAPQALLPIIGRAYGRPMQPIICTIRREVDVYVAMSRGRDLAQGIGFSTVDRTRIEIVILELTRNLLVHAKGGSITFTQLAHATRGHGMAIESHDTGPGIADIGLAMQDGYSTASTLGAGLPGVKRLMDEFHIESTLGVGTYVRAIKWLQPDRKAQIYGR